MRRPTREAVEFYAMVALVAVLAALSGWAFLYIFITILYAFIEVLS